MNTKQLLEELRTHAYKNPLDMMVHLLINGKMSRIVRFTRIQNTVAPFPYIHLTHMCATGFFSQSVTLHGLLQALDTLVPVCRTDSICFQGWADSEMKNREVFAVYENAGVLVLEVKDAG